MFIYHLGMNNRLVGGRRSETSHPIDTFMVKELQCYVTDKGKPKNLERSLSQWHYANHKSNMD
jgi:hypothetical protein